MIDKIDVKPLQFVGDSDKQLRSFPKEVRFVMGQALWAAQIGKKHPDAKPLKGFTGASVVEIVADYDTNTYRGVYTVKLAGVVYVLHTFQKKSKRGIATPKQEVELIGKRLKEAGQHHKEHYALRRKP